MEGKHEGVLEHGTARIFSCRWMAGLVLGGCDGLLYALIALAVVDYITGVMCAVTDHKLSSEIGFKGIFKRCSSLSWWVWPTSWM